MGVCDYFSQFASKASRATGHPYTFMGAALMILVWLAMGPYFNESNGWQLVMNTVTSIITFLMVFLIQNTQNRDTRAIQIKLDELIRSQRGAHNAIIDLQALSDDELEAIGNRYSELAAKAREAMKRGDHQIDTPDVNVELPEKPPP